MRDDASEPEDEKPSLAFALDFLEKADEMEDEALLAAREEEVKVPGRSVTRWVEPLTVPVMKTPAASVCPRQLGLEAEREGKGSARTCERVVPLEAQVGRADGGEGCVGGGEACGIRVGCG